MHLRPQQKQLIGISILIILLLGIIFVLVLSFGKEPKTLPLETEIPIIDTENTQSEIETQEPDSSIPEQSNSYDITGSDVISFLEKESTNASTAIILCSSQLITSSQNQELPMVFLTSENGDVLYIESEQHNIYPLFGINYGRQLSGMTICKGDEKNFYSMSGFLKEDTQTIWDAYTKIPISETDTFFQYELKDIDENVIGIIFIPTTITEPNLESEDIQNLEE